MILEIPPALGSDLVYIEGHAGAQLLEHESDVDLYAEVFADALARSHEPGESAELVRSAPTTCSPKGFSVSDFPSAVEYKISSYCSFGNCVEVGRSPEGAVMVRDRRTACRS